MYKIKKLNVIWTLNVSDYNHFFSTQLNIYISVTFIIL